MTLKHTTLRLVTAALLLLTPLSTAAATITVDDTIAGLGTTADLTDLVPRDHFTLQLTNPMGQTTESTVTASSKGTASVTINANDTVRAGNYRIDLLKDAQRIANGITFDVVPDSVDPGKSLVDTDVDSIEADGRDSAEVTVVLYDQYGNPLPGRPVSLISNRSDDFIESDTQQTNSRGEQFFFVSTYEPGDINLRAIDLLSGHTVDQTIAIRVRGGQAFGDNLRTNTFSNDRFYYGNQSRAGNRFAAQLSNFDIIDSFEITAPPQIPRGEEVSKISIRAIDRGGNTVENYIGTVLFSSTDPSAILPNFGEYTFRERDLGEKEFPLVLTFEEVGTQIFKVEDVNDGNIVGEAIIDVTGTGPAAPSGTITIESPRNNTDITTDVVTVEGVGPVYSNVIAIGGIQDASGETDGDGKFSIDVTLDTAAEEITLRVQDESGRHVSNPILLRRNTTPPVIEDLNFIPQESVEGENVLAVLIAEPGLSNAIIRINDDEELITLTEKEDEPGVYQAFFTGPGIGEYDPVAEVTNIHGISATQAGFFNVVTRTVPKVLGVQAIPGSNAISLEWEPVEDVDSYRIYTGEEPDTYLYTLDTDQPITRATVAGLEAGQVYYFAVTALRDNNESAEKSDVISSQVIGLTLTIEEQNSLVTLLWDFPGATDIRSFSLEYGVEPGIYTEERIVNGNQRRYMIPDLINGVTYYFRLTPINTDRDRVIELAQTITGTPNGPINGIFFSRAKPVSQDLLGQALPITEHIPPEVNKVGSPSIIVGSILLIAILLVLVYGRANRRRSYQYA